MFPGILCVPPSPDGGRGGGVGGMLPLVVWTWGLIKTGISYLPPSPDRGGGVGECCSFLCLLIVVRTWSLSETGDIIFPPPPRQGSWGNVARCFVCALDLGPRRDRGYHIPPSPSRGEGGMLLVLLLLFDIFGLGASARLGISYSPFPDRGVGGMLLFVVRTWSLRVSAKLGILQLGCGRVYWREAAVGVKEEWVGEIRTLGVWQSGMSSGGGGGGVRCDSSE